MDPFAAQRLQRSIHYAIDYFWDLPHCEEHYPTAWLAWQSTLTGFIAHTLVADWTKWHGKLSPRISRYYPTLHTSIEPGLHRSIFRGRPEGF